jgi:membrane-bound ClpP family serine protease
MKNNKDINRLTEEALNSLDGAGRATAKPYLLTRINARMQNQKESSWDNALKFISRPAVALAGLCLIIGINAMVVSYNYPGKAATATEDQYVSVDEYSSSSIAVLKDLENIEP